MTCYLFPKILFPVVGIAKNFVEKSPLVLALSRKNLKGVKMTPSLNPLRVKVLSTRIRFHRERYRFSMKMQGLYYIYTSFSYRSYSLWRPF